MSMGCTEFFRDTCVVLRIYGVRYVMDYPRMIVQR